MPVKTLTDMLSPKELLGYVVPGAVLVYGLALSGGAVLPLPEGWPASAFDQLIAAVLSLIAGYLIQEPAHLLNYPYDKLYAPWRRRKGDRLHDEARRLAGDDVGPGESLYAHASGALRADPARHRGAAFAEGVSKLFRALAFALYGLAVWLGAAAGMWPHAAAAFGLALLATLVFFRQRHQATCEFYAGYIELRRRNG
jgi:hypothetical protein